jgi:hypothetical protein
MKPNIRDIEHLAELWQHYKDDLTQRAAVWKKTSYVGGMGRKVEDTPKLPLTMEGFKRFCHDQGIGTVEQYFTNQDGLYDSYIGIAARIRNEIREDQIIGGILKTYDSSIVARINNLAETVNNRNHNIKILSIDPLAPADEE